MMQTVKMGDVWDRATEFLSDNLGVIVPITLLAVFVPSSIQGSLAPLAETPGTVATTIQLVSLGLSIISLWGQLAIIALAIDPAIGRDGATRSATARLLPSLGVALLTLVGAVILLLPVPLALALAGFDFTAAMNGGTSMPDLPASTSLFISLYALVFLVAMIWLAARLALLNPVVVAERRGIGAFARSFALTRGITWKIIGVVLLFGIVAIVAVLAARTVFGSILALLAGGEGPITIASVMTAILVGAVTTGFTVLAAAFTAKLYLAAHGVRQGIAEPA